MTKPEMIRGRNIENRLWDERTSLIAEMIREGESVLEFGSGRQVLAKLLPSDRVYTPYDIEDCDLNDKTLPLFPPHDVAVFGGVLEYVEDIPRLVRRLAPSFPAVIASYAGTDFNTSNRENMNWVNNYTIGELIGVFRKAGYWHVSVKTWRRQCIIRFHHSR